MVTADNIWNSVEKKWLEFWEVNNVNISDPNSNNEKFFITVAYPYPNSPQHIGHGRTYTIADVHARYFRLKGFNVLFPMAFHYTGTPILGMSKRVQVGDKEIIDNFRNIFHIEEKDIRTFVDPLQIARFFHNEIKEGMKEMGYSIDWRHEFTTIDVIYKKLISWQFKTLRDLGVIEQGSHPVGWCPNDSNPVSQHDTLGDVEPSFTEYSLIKFKLKDENVFLPVATLRPETIFGATNLWLNPDEQYLLVSVNESQEWIVSESSAKKLEYLNYSINRIKIVNGKNLIGTIVETPLTNRNIPILPASFVTLDEGTGIVMSVPAHAPYDMQALLDLERISPKLLSELDLEVIIPFSIIDSKIGFRDGTNNEIDTLLDTKITEEDNNNSPSHIVDNKRTNDLPSVYFLNKYSISDQSDVNLEKATSDQYSLEFYNGIMNNKALDYSGLSVSEAKDKVKEQLFKLNHSVSFFELTNKPVFCRCGSQCYVKLLDNQWFLNYGNPKWKSLALKCLEQIEIIPVEIIAEFKNVFDWLKVRACARKTGLGTPLPWDKEWIIESLSDSVIYMVYYIIAKYVNIHNLEKYKDIVDNSFFDFIILNKRTGYFKGIEEGSGSVGNLNTMTKEPSIDPIYLKEFLDLSIKIRNDFVYYYPLDSRHSGRDLVPNHLSFFIFNHSIIFPESLWPKQIVVNGSVLLDGKKMSKSMGNIIPLRNTIKQYNADSIRVAMLVLGELLQDVDFSFTTLKGIYTRLNEIYEFSLNFIQKNDSIINSMNSDQDIIDALDDLALEDKWLLNRINILITELTHSFDELRIRDALNTALYIMDKDFDWYKKRKLSKSGTITSNIKDAFVIYLFLKMRIKILAPFCPFLAEELWQHFDPEGNSIFRNFWPRTIAKFADPLTEENEQLIYDIQNDLNKILKVTRNDNPKIIFIYISSAEKQYLYSKVLDMIIISKTKNFGDIMKSLLSDSSFTIETKNYIKNNTDFIKKIHGDILSLSPNQQERRSKIKSFDERIPLIDSLSLLSTEIKVPVENFKIFHENDLEIIDPTKKARLSRPFKPAIFIE